ncbi:MAG: hypothetical protein JSR58_07255 [Verrucomicrobia bacterium]|nr:hypothetical protein [Verrucomicrobiota bacterium]
MSTTYKIQHSDQAPEFFNWLKQNKECEILYPFCHEAEYNTAQNAPNRSQVMIDRFVQRVYEGSQQWMSRFLSGDLKYNSPAEAGPWLVQLVEIQQGNHLYQRVTRTYGKDSRIQELTQKKFASHQELAQYVQSKGLNVTPLVYPRETQELSLQHSGFSMLESLQMDEGLKFVDLSHNKLASIDRLKFPKSIVTLDLSYNQFTEVPQNLGDVRNLILRGNPLKKLTKFEGLNTIDRLDISYLKTDPNSEFNVDFSFYEVIEARESPLTIVLSPYIPFIITEQLRGKINFEPALPTQTIRFNGHLVICDPAPADASPPVHLAPPQVSKTPKKSLSLWSKIAMWTGIPALIVGLGYLAMKLWQRARA